MFGAHRHDRPARRPRRPAFRYGSRGAQFRLLLAVFCWMGLLMLIVEAAKPKHWQWIWRDSAAIPAAPGPAAPFEEAIDPRQAAPRPIRDAAGTVTIRRNGPPAQPGDSYESDHRWLGIPPERFAVVRDNSVLRSTETELWYDLLAAMQRGSGDPELLPPAPRVGFTQLYKQPEFYRGRRVLVSGVVRRCHRLSAPQNPHLIDAYYRCWLFPEGSGNPIVVHALTMPAEFPTGMSLEETVSFEGVFFKRWAYAAQGGLMSAPLVLAAEGHWTPHPREPDRPLPSLTTAICSALAAALIAIIVSLYIYRQSVTAGEEK